jgi:superfamily II DNA or RNA helicase
MSAEATVVGTDIYYVDIDIHDKGVFVCCTCPYYMDEWEPCKHIWATLLTAESKGMLVGNGEPIAPRLLLEEVEIRLPKGGVITGFGSSFSPVPAGSAVPPKPASVPQWKLTLQRVGSLAAPPVQRTGYGVPTPATWPAGRALSYRIELPEQIGATTISIEILGVDIKANGEPGKLKSIPVGSDHIPLVPDPADRRILAALVGGRDPGSRYSYPYGYGYYGHQPSSQSTFSLGYGPAAELLPEICVTGRAYVQQRKWIEPRIVHWEPEPIELWLAIHPQKSGGWLCSLELRLHGECLDRTALRMLFSNRMALLEDTFVMFEQGTPHEWLDLLAAPPFAIASEEEADQFFATLLALPRIPHLDLPENLRFEHLQGIPRMRLMVKQGTMRRSGGMIPLRGELSFIYEGVEVASGEKRDAIYIPEGRRLAERDEEAEMRGRARLLELGFRQRSDREAGGEWFELSMKKLPSVVRTLLAEEWIVEAEGKLYRQSTGFTMSVKSNVDWFDLEGGADFGGMIVALPRLLAALRKGEETVMLDDGTFGILPETWVARYAKLARAGTDGEDHIRFSRAQVGLLDALLAEQPEVHLDEAFEKIRRELLDFRGIEPVDPPASFVGTLREYQREALGWMFFLQRFGFGGCLADDMGLGKTPMALALLATRKDERDRTLAAARRKDGKLRARPKVAPVPPSLVVVPKTLVFNWMSEAKQFLPSLRVINHTGLGRSKDGAEFDDADLVITTYGTLRRDALLFREREFDYLILDEAQAIKNSSTESAKAARLLRGRHRLALSGTPIENHLGELWSLFEFLNPGMLGGVNALGLAASGAKGVDEETRRILARALRPFILRRTKGEVAKDLPAKTEQTIWCELEPEQRKMYDELRTHYRGALLGRLEVEGMGKSKIQILEALLRLRQAACHPGLVDKRRLKDPAAKIETLMEKIHEVIESGGKALVFSQFTSLLAILRKALDAETIAYEYLDGKTHDRQAHVQRFQSESGPSLFLISLKAGGVGLNLTAAEYVFLLDPWWNPAVEAQAIDRTHRIGQTKPVFAYRIVATDTVEEKILELQKTKRDLADAIVGAENSLIRQMTREDLELLLS